MSKSDIAQNETAIGTGTSHLQQFIYRLPKRNHEDMMKIQKQFNTIFRQHGVPSREVYYLDNIETVGGFTNLAKTVSANQDEEEVLTALVLYRDRKQRDELVSKIRDDENYRALLQQFMNLLAPQSGTIIGEFGHLNI
jgi:uncharacterized protein YbaA (DUF1428 family)